MWECGLKQKKTKDIVELREVTPHVGVWIETETAENLRAVFQVTPHVGVWIETALEHYDDKYLSHSPCGSVD